MPNPEAPREQLVVPDPTELGVVMQGLLGRVTRAAERGDKAENYGDIGYENANRILADNPHLLGHFEACASRLAVVAEQKGLGIDDAYLVGVKDVLEIMATAATNAQLPDLEDPTV